MSFITPSENNIIVYSWHDWYYRDANEEEYLAAEAEEREELLRQDMEEREAEFERGDRPEEEEEVVENIGEEVFLTVHFSANLPHWLRHASVAEYHQLRSHAGQVRPAFAGS